MKKIYVRVKGGWHSLKVEGDKEDCELLAGILMNYYKLITEEEHMQSAMV